MKKRVSGFFIIVAVVVMLPAARVQAGTVPGLFGTEGYYVRLPSGEIYLFPVQKPAVAKRKKACDVFRKKAGRERRVPPPQWSWRSPRPRFYNNPPPPPFGLQPRLPWSGGPSWRPLYLPRFDAAKAPRR